ncbi:lysozyme inhibitor LprI family protein [Pseudoduganella sp. RAF19]|uniref:lysozyme inhibitor LprI family protein n=1 Tax=Pseudoduganella sp. RAF19 TaxID=3233052 RepID=UPI003F9A4B65
MSNALETNTKVPMNQSKVGVLVFSLLLAVGTAFADVGGDTRDAELKHFDKELNVVYSKIIQRLNVKGQQKLKAAQRAWLQMRDLDCEWAYRDKRDCLIDRTVNRTKELTDTDFDAKDGEYGAIDLGAVK